MTGPTTVMNAGAASRQKNCNGCVQAKRRCDRRTPICSRCAEKRATCIYGKARTVVGRLGPRRAREPTPCTQALSLASPAFSPLTFPALSFDMSCLEGMPTDFHPDLAATPQSLQDTVPGGDIPMDAFLHFVDNGSSSPASWLTSTEKDHLPDLLRTPVDEDVVMRYDKMSACEFDASHVYDPKTAIYHIVQCVKGFVGEMATKNVTRFIHPRLYQHHKPRCIVLCFAACVLYESRTPTNRAMVMRALSDGARELVDAAATGPPPTPAEKLARVQALLLYQVIRLFDGDVALRAQGERDTALLRTWLAELRHLRDNLGDLARLGHASVREQPPVEWEKWIFAECVRRTVLITYATLSLYELLKDPEHDDPDHIWDYVHRWTLGRSLWEARSSAEFWRAWRESPHFVVTNFTFDDFLEAGDSGELDEFAQMLLTAYMGADAMNDFVAPRGN
ncbi:hypothetical protein F4802DRAFT_503901 [Xylaria palmicola]|nr:hypothetical protein F4802DRAFT_503901 [Xylaria palmicola]